MRRLDHPSLFDDMALSADIARLEDVLSLNALVSLAVALGATQVPEWTEQERELVGGLAGIHTKLVATVRDRIEAGEDPLGEIFCRLRSSEERRPQGATFTPMPIVAWMLRQVARGFGLPERVIDPGAGSGRFLVSAGRCFASAELLGVEIDPFSAILARANLAAAGMARRAQILLGDYRDAPIKPIAGRTLYIANPPYVRHHQIDAPWKNWLVVKARQLNLSASQLAGLHVHFFLSTVLRAKPNDFGAFITAAEWLDVNYGSLVRDLFLGPLGGKRVDVIEPSAMPFPNAAATAAITTFEIGSRPTTVTLRRVGTIESLDDKTKEHTVRRERLESEARWSRLTRPASKGPHGYIELGELFRVHRGQVTGANKVWIAGKHSLELPESVLFPTVTKAKELFTAGKVLLDTSELRRVIDLPPDLDVFAAEEKKAVERFIAQARKLGVNNGYVACNRKAWWSVGLRQPAPILATYMARRPPAFVRNIAEARHINVAHGLYPREPLGDTVLISLVEYLASAVTMAQGRTYAGGLTKFEPREMEQLLVPGLEILRQGLVR
jgi:methylase of polypeptide subunit release factors